jgi:predicted lipoprotein with Yx(FWY)xxD motif
MRWKTLVGIGVVAGAVAMAGCGTGTGGAGAGNASATVSARDVANVGTTLVTSAGDTLYFADQENGGRIQCVDACVRFWIPLTVKAGAEVTAGAGVSGRLATITRPDGRVQVTYEGKPLYTFTDDGGPGHADGNGFTDSFNGTDFQWHAATVSGSAPAATVENHGGY